MDAGDCEFDRQHIARLAGRVVTGCAVDRTHRAVGKGLCVEAGGSLGVLIVPKANRVFGHCVSFRAVYARVSTDAALSPPPGDDHDLQAMLPNERYSSP